MKQVPPPPSVRPMVAGDLAGIADMLVRSFDDDPIATFIFDGERRRARGLHSFFTSQIRRQYFDPGGIQAIDGLGGVAVWGTPGRPRHPVRELIGLLPTAPFLVGPNMVRALRLLAEVDSLHPKEPHWYLATLGVEPHLQGHGVGSALLRAGLRRADEEGIPAYLESSKDRNVPLYARFGFEVVEELHSRTGAPPMWRMWRQPHVPDE